MSPRYKWLTVGRTVLVILFILSGMNLALAVNPVPFVSQPLVPSSAAPGGPGFTLTVNGAGFVQGATVNWDGVSLSTTFVSSAQLTATVTAADIASPGTASIIVTNPCALASCPTLVASNVVYLPISALSSSATFAGAPGSPVTVGNKPESIVAADFNSDGKPDLAIANWSSGTLTILLGKGDGTFTSASGSPIAIGLEPESISVGDFNNDGKLDLAVLNGGTSTLVILLGNGDGTFTQGPQSLSLPAGGVSGYPETVVATGDFNGDGSLDLAVAYFAFNTNEVTVFLGRGDGTFDTGPSTPSGGSTPFSIAVGDFNRDGKLDLAVANYYSNNVNILLGNGDGTFTPAPDSPIALPLGSNVFGVGPTSVAVADLNGDGRLDLAVTSLADNGVIILLGNGDGTFALGSGSLLGLVSAPFAVTDGDFNSDGHPDLAVTDNLAGGGLQIYQGNGDGSFTASSSSVTTGYTPYAVAVGDFNGDGQLDLATANYNDATISVLLQPPAAASLVLSPATPSPNTGGSETLTATARATDGTALIGLDVTFTVTGANPTSGTGVTDTTGRATFSYVGSNPGTDTAIASAVINQNTVTSNQASIQWTAQASPPSITSVSPASGIQGQTLTSFTVTGSNFQPTSTLSFSGTGLSVSSYTLRTATQIVANVSIALGTATGARDVIVTNPDGQTATGAGAFTVVPLTLSVCLASSTSCAQSLSFSYQQGTKTAISAQTLTISTNGPTLTYTASAWISNGAGWLLVAPSGGTTPSSISVSVEPGLPSGTYTGQVTISAPGASNSPQTVAVNLAVSPTPPTLPAPGYGSVSQEEAAFRQVLGQQWNSGNNFPILPPQSVGDSEIWSGLQSVLGTECKGYNATATILLPNSAKTSACAGESAATQHVLSLAFLSLAQGFVTNALDLFGPTTTLGGKLVLAGAKVFVATVVGPNPKSQLIISSSEQLLAPMLGKLVGDYLSQPAAKLAMTPISQTLGEDNLTSDEVTDASVTVDSVSMTASVAWAYNPFTHYVVAFISTSQSPDAFYAVYYEVNSNGIMVSRSSSGLPVSETMFSCQNSCSAITGR